MKSFKPYIEIDPATEDRPKGTGNVMDEVEWLICGGPSDNTIFDVYSWRDHVYVWADDAVIRYEPQVLRHEGFIYLIATPEGVPIAIDDEELYDRITYLELQPVSRLN